MKFVVFSLGCRVNQYEGQSIISELKKRGFEASDKPGYADCYIINTCSITAEADKKSRQAVARMLRYNPSARVVVCGCSSQNDPKPYENKQNVVYIGGTGGKMSIIENIMSDIVLRNNVTRPPTSYEDDLYPELTRARAFLKVQDGCNNFCSYCIIPYLRGRSRSRALSAVLDEARETAKKTSEIVITGINVSDYGSDIGCTLKDLVRGMGDIPVRKRFGSLECTVVDEELLQLMKRGGWCDYVHLSMQSGSDGVLKRMNRKYNSAQFIEKCDLIRSVFPEAGITTDVIAGFPGETDEEFAETVEVCRRAAFSGLHVFPYSLRPGTVAARLPQVDAQVKAERAARLGEVGAELKAAFLDSEMGKEKEIVVEELSGGYLIGHTSNYIKIYLPPPDGEVPEGKLVKVKLTRPFRDGAKGEII